MAVCLSNCEISNYLVSLKTTTEVVSCGIELEYSSLFQRNHLKNADSMIKLMTKAVISEIELGKF